MRYKSKLNKMFFSVSPKKVEVDAIKTARPQNILLSYGSWGGIKNGKYKFGSFIESLWKLDYRPTVFIDSGAFKFHRDSLDISLDSLAYLYEDTYEMDLSTREIAVERLMDIHHGGFDVVCDIEDQDIISNYVSFILRNLNYIDYVVCLDHFSDSNLSFNNFMFFKQLGIKCIPTYHINEQDNSVLDRYIEEGANYIGLGGIVPVKLAGGKGVYERIINWVNETVEEYPNVKFHLFGTQDPNILDKISPLLYSADGTAWVMNAANTYNRSIEGHKTELAVKNILIKDIRGDINV